MPGRYLASGAAVAKATPVRDAVKASSVLGFLFMLCLAGCVYGTYALGQLLLPSAKQTNASTSSLNAVESLPDYIVGAIPFFFVMMGLEAVLLWLGNVKPVAAQYDAVDTWSSLTAGTTQTLVSIIAKPFISLTAVYCWIWDEYALTRVLADENSLLVAALCFVVGDFCYYWFHRNAHEIHVLWAGHSVHHSSEHYNLSTALRQSWLQALVSLVWSLPAALFLPPVVYVLCQQWVTLYQFWVHTCVVRRLPGFIELIFVTPSHHRMHHDRRLHKNFAGVFIVWDRIFGTFQDEFADSVAASDDGLANSDGEEIAYFGITDVTTSWADSVTQLLIWEKIGRAFSKGTLKGLRHTFFGPGFSTSTARRPLPSVCDAETRRIRADRSRVTAAQKILVTAMFTWSIVGLVSLLIQGSQLDPTTKAVSILLLLLSMLNQGLIYDQNKLGFLSEVVRCLFCIAFSGALPFAGGAEAHCGILVALALFGQRFS